MRCCSTLLVAAAALAACSTCGGKPAAPDARRPDVSRPPPRDLVQDQGPDRFPSGCGGSRVLDPKPVPRRASKACGKGCRRITFGADADVSYEIAGKLLVYSGGIGLGLDVSVYMVDLDQNREWLVHAAVPDRPGCFEVDTDGQRLAYSCTIKPDPHSTTYVAPLQVYDPDTRVEQDLACLYLDHGTRPFNVTLASTGVAASVSLSARVTPDIYFARFADGSLSNLTNQVGGWFSNADGPLLVWTQVINDTGQMLTILHDTEGHRSRPVDAVTPGRQWEPRIEGTKIVWTDHRNADGNMWHQLNSDIYLHDLSTGKTTAVTTHPAMQTHPDVWGDWVVWEDYRNNPNPTPLYSNEFINADIYAKNLKTGQELQLTSFPGLELKPRIDNGRVIFRAYGPDKHLALFMIDLTERERQ